MGKTRDTLKKISITEGTFHAKMDSIKHKICMDLRDADDTNKMWKEYRVELFKKDLQDPDIQNGVIPHLEPDILECEVKWAIERITTNNACGGYEIFIERFQILKDDFVKVLHSICQQIGK